jgi:hypothetical protein
MTAIDEIRSIIETLRPRLALARASTSLSAVWRLEDTIAAYEDCATIIQSHAEAASAMEALGTEELMLRLASALEARTLAGYEAQLCRRARQVAYAAIAEQARQEAGL